jgi:hypothetical protein
MVYVRADTEMQRRAIEKAEAMSAAVIHTAENDVAIWQGNDAMIKKLCGLA